MPSVESFVRQGFSYPPRERQGDGSWPLSGISSTCHSHGPRFQHPGGFYSSGRQGQISSSPVILHLGGSRHCITEMIPVIRTSHSWDASVIPQQCIWFLLFEHFPSSFSWQAVLDLHHYVFVLPVNQEDYFTSDPCHSSYRWRSENLWGLTSGCWTQIRNLSQPAILNTWISNSRQLLLYSLWRK